MSTGFQRPLRHEYVGDFVIDILYEYEFLIVVQYVHLLFCKLLIHVFLLFCFALFFNFLLFCFCSLFCVCQFFCITNFQKGQLYSKNMSRRRKRVPFWFLAQASQCLVMFLSVDKEDTYLIHVNIFLLDIYYWRR